MNMIVNNYKDFYNKWKDVIGEYTYCHKLYEEKVKKTAAKATTDFDFNALDDIMCSVIKSDLYKSLCLLLTQSTTIISKLANSFYDKEGNFIDDYSALKYEELEQYILKLGGSPLKFKSYTFIQYTKELEIVEQEFQKKIKQLKKEQQELSLTNQFLESRNKEIENFFETIKKNIEEQEKEKKTV